MNILSVPVDQLLPQKAPFLMVDRVLAVNGEQIECLKYLAYNEPYSAGHFPAQPPFPGMLLQEACAQASLLLELSWAEEGAPRRLGWAKAGWPKAP